MLTMTNSLNYSVPLSTTFQLPCVAAHFYTIDNADQIAPVMLALARAHRPFKILGGGSNVLCASSQIDTVLCVNIKGIDCLNTNQRADTDAWLVQVGAGENWHDLVMYTLNQGWLGLENLALIPGLVGAAPVQNIGAYGVELCDRLHSVQAWDTQQACLVEIAAKDCQFAYRDSVFKQAMGRYIITHVTFSLPRPWQPVLHYGELAQLDRAIYDDSQAHALAIAYTVMGIRQRKLPDPVVTPNAGSFFKNPLVHKNQALALKTIYPALPMYLQAHAPEALAYKLAAGWLIEAAGWKGHVRRGSAGGRVGVHAMQALVLVHLGGATGADILQLASDIQASVLAQFGVTLEREVNVW
jgi:UDP-N-acetylmuramate dehydrogenase